MDKTEKIIKEAFAELFILMFNNKTDNVELIFDFNKCKAKFKVSLEEVEQKKKGE